MPFLLTCWTFSFSCLHELPSLQPNSTSIFFFFLPNLTHCGLTITFHGEDSRVTVPPLPRLWFQFWDTVRCISY
jgi:hypothetical protein